MDVQLFVIDFGCPVIYSQGVINSDDECRVCSAHSQNGTDVKVISSVELVHIRTQYQADNNTNSSLNGGGLKTGKSPGVPPELILIGDLATIRAKKWVSIMESFVSYASSYKPGTPEVYKVGDRVIEVLYEAGRYEHLNNGQGTSFTMWKYGGVRYSVRYHVNDKWEVINTQLGWTSNGWQGALHNGY